jgi:hypothetical protein
MAQHLVALVVAFIELLEAEAERLKLGLRGLLLTGAVIAVGAAVAGTALAAGVGFLLWALYLALLTATSAAWAALIVGLVVWIVMGGGGWLVVRSLRKS